MYYLQGCSRGKMSGIIEDCIVRGMEYYLKKVSILVEAKITDSWGGESNVCYEQNTTSGPTGFP